MSISKTYVDDELVEVVNHGGSENTLIGGSRYDEAYRRQLSLDLVMPPKRAALPPRPPSRNDPLRMSTGLTRDPGCQLCRLHKTAEYVCLLGQGPKQCDVMIIGEAPGAREDDSGKPFVGRSGRLLEDMLEAEGFARADLFITNAVSCRPPDNRTPSKGEVKACKAWLDYQIASVKPKFVLLLGNTPLLAITGKTGITKQRGHPFEKDGIVYLPTYHPAFILRDETQRPTMERDIHLFRSIVDREEIPREDKLKHTIVRTRADVEAMLRALRNDVSFDIETNGLYPWQTHITKGVKGRNVRIPKLAKITMIGFGTADGEFSLPVDHPESPWTPEAIAGIISEITPHLQKCRVICHNGKFDMLWMLVFYGVLWYELMEFDTMLAHYVLDENSLHGLKYLAQKFCGAPDWDIDNREKAAEDTPLAKLGVYHGHDLYYTRQLFYIFRKMLAEDFDVKRVFSKILMPCARLFVEVEFDGVYIDVTKFDEAEDYLREEFDKALEELEEYEPPALLDRKGNPIEFNWGSPQQLSKLLFEDLKIPVLDRTKTGAASCSESVIKRIDHPCAGALLRFRGAKQQLSFFIDGWKPFLHRKYVKGRWLYFLHPSFKLHGTVTGRLSCIRKGSRVQVPGGTKAIEDIKVGEWVYTYDDERRLTLRKVTNKWYRGRRKCVRLYWKGQGGKTHGYLDLTPDHRIKTREGRFVEAGTLVENQSIVALHRSTRERNHLYATGYHKKLIEARVVFESTKGWSPEHVHHEDENPLNDNPLNLVGMSHRAHMSLHNRKLANVPGEMSRRAYARSPEAKKRNARAVSAAGKAKAERRFTREQLEEALARGGGILKAKEILGCSYEALKRRIDDWGLHQPDGRKAPNNNHLVDYLEPLEGLYPVYDIEVEGTHNFIVNEICSHNCEHPNLQQVPRDPRIRQLVDAMPGWTLLECDLSQIELRIAAELAGERNMLEAFINKIDVHWLTAIREIERGGGGELIGVAIETAKMFLMQLSLPPNRAGSEVLLNLWEANKKRASTGEFLQSLHKDRKVPETGSGERGQPTRRNELILERWRSHLGEEASKELLRAMRSYEELVLTSYGQEPSKQSKIQFTDAMSILSLMGPSIASELRSEWKEIRKKAKAVNFGFLYGMWWKKFKLYARDNYGVTVTDDQAKDSRIAFFDMYPVYPKWHKRQRRFANQHGYVRSLSGRKRRLPQATMREDTPERQSAERQAINSPVQSFANELNLMAALQLREEFGRDVVRICGTVHDAILAQVRNDMVPQVTKRLLEIMSAPDLLKEFDIEIGVPIEAEAKLGPWSQGISLEKWIKKYGQTKEMAE